MDSIWIQMAALLGSRLAFVIVHPEYYGANPGKVLAVWEGGLAWPGAILGAIAALVLIAFYREIKLAALADQMAVILLPVSISLWLGGWVSGVAYGAQLPEGTWYGFNTVDAYGQYAIRFPLQAITSILMLIGSGLIERRTQKSAAGLFAISESSLLMALLLATSIFRADPQQEWAGWPVEAWIASSLLTVSLAGVLIFSIRYADKPRQVR